MATNDSRSMNADFAQGTIDQTYIQLTPNRTNPDSPPVERYDWPQFKNVDRWAESPFLEADLKRVGRPIEQRSSGDGDTRF